MSLCSNQGLYINVIMLKSMFLYINVIMLKSMFIYKCHYAQINVYIYVIMLKSMFIYKCYYAQVKLLYKCCDLSGFRNYMSTFTFKLNIIMSAKIQCSACLNRDNT